MVIKNSYTANLHLTEEVAYGEFAPTLAQQISKHDSPRDAGTRQSRQGMMALEQDSFGRGMDEVCL